MDVYAIQAAISALENGPSPLEFTTSPIGDCFFVAKSHMGEPCFGVLYESGFVLPGSRETQGITLEFYPEFEVRGEPFPRVSRVGLLRCRDTRLAYQFAVMVEGYLAVAGLPLNPGHLLQYIEDWEDLLNRGRHLSHQEEVGLWGELRVIHSAPDRNGMLAAWHGPDGSTFDFSADNLDVDVKTSAHGHKHRFSLAQLLPSPSQAKRYVLSLHVTEDNAGGLTLTELINDIRETTVDKVLLEKKLLAVGYSDSFTYVTPYSQVTSKLIDTGVIPGVHQVDPGVTEVQFTSDLSSCPQISGEQSVVILNKLCGIGPKL